MSRGGTDRQPTGIFAFSGETIKIFVDANNDDPLPNIIFTQFLGPYNKWYGSSIPLKKGINILTANDFNISEIKEDIRAGGPLYIENKYTPEEQSQNVKIYIDGGGLFPLFRINDNEEEFRTFLNDYIDKYNKSKDEYYDIAEFYTNKIIISVKATFANETYNGKKIESPQKNLENWDEIIKILYIFDGIQFEPDQPYYNIKNEYIKLHIRHATNIQPEFGAYAFDEHIGIFNEMDLRDSLISYHEIGKTLAHEIGHMIDVYYREYAERTNCVLEEYTIEVIYRSLYIYTLKKMEILYTEVAPDNIDNSLRNCEGKENCNGFFINSGNYKYNHYIWWAIESFYPGYWGKLNNLFRFNKTLHFGMNKNEAMIYLSSLVLGFNMEYYFERFSLAMENDKIFNKSETSEIYKNQLEKSIKEGKIKLEYIKNYGMQILINIIIHLIMGPGAIKMIMIMK